MRNRDYVYIEEKSSPIKTIFKIVTTVAVVACAATVAYKYVKDKIDSTILGKLDLDGDGEPETLILDTTGDGEIDTIIINSDPNED
jgi:hypothetical protein